MNIFFASDENIYNAKIEIEETFIQFNENLRKRE